MNRQSALAQAKGLGRYGDTELVHVSKPELAMMNAQTPGGLTTNPHTGLPEAFNWGSVLGAIAPLAMFIPGVGPAITGGLEAMGASAGVAGALAPALLSAGGTLAGGGSLSQAAMSGLGAGVMGGLSGMGSAGQGAAQSVAQTANSGGIANAVNAGSQASAAGAAVNPAAAPAASDALTEINVTPAVNASNLYGSSIAPASAIGDPANLTMPGSNLPSTSALMQGGGNAVSMLKRYGLPAGFAAMGLMGAGSPSSLQSPSTVNKNPNAGKEVMASYNVATPSPNYFAGGPGGEMYYVPQQITTGTDWTYSNGAPNTSYADGGQVTTGSSAPDLANPAPYTPVFNPALFANSFTKPDITAQTTRIGGYGSANPGTMNAADQAAWTQQYAAANTPSNVQATANTPTSNTSSGTPDWNALLTARPDVMQAYQLAVNGGTNAQGQTVPKADPNSPQYAKMGLSSPQAYAQNWYNNMGGNQSYTVPTVATSANDPTLASTTGGGQSGLMLPPVQSGASTTAQTGLGNITIPQLQSILAQYGSGSTGATSTSGYANGGPVIGLPYANGGPIIGLPFDNGGAVPVAAPPQDPAGPPVPYSLNSPSGPSAPQGPGAVQGPGDGSSDSIPATINHRTPAKLSQGEFVVPSDVVSHLGNGSNTAGAQRLQGLVHGVRKFKTGRTTLPPRI